MTEQDKQLLLKDISARFPYGVVLDIDTTDWKAPQGHIKVKIEGFGFLSKDMSLIVNGCYYGDKYKPYLRPMSSMTEEECNFVYNGHISFWVIEDYCNKHHLDYRGLIPKGLALEAPEGMYDLKNT